jgi:hypothetical protein
MKHAYTMSARRFNEASSALRRYLDNPRNPQSGPEFSRLLNELKAAEDQMRRDGVLVYTVRKAVPGLIYELYSNSELVFTAKPREMFNEIEQRRIIDVGELCRLWKKLEIAYEIWWIASVPKNKRSLVA